MNQQQQQGTTIDRTVGGGDHVDSIAALEDGPLVEQERTANILLNEIIKHKKSTSKESMLVPALPEHLQHFKDVLERPAKIPIKNPQYLPVVGQLSPRTKKKLSLMPKPSEMEINKVKKIEEDLKKIKPESVYATLTAAADKALFNAHYNHELEPIEQAIEARKNDPLQLGFVPPPLTAFDQKPRVETTKTMYDRANIFKKLSQEKKEKFTIMFGDTTATSVNDIQSDAETVNGPGSIVTDTSSTMLPSIHSRKQNYPFQTDLTQKLMKNAMQRRQIILDAKAQTTQLNNSTISNQEAPKPKEEKVSSSSITMSKAVDIYKIPVKYPSSSNLGKHLTRKQASSSGVFSGRSGSAETLASAGINGSMMSKSSPNSELLELLTAATGRSVVVTEKPVIEVDNISESVASSVERSQRSSPQASPSGSVNSTTNDKSVHHNVLVNSDDEDLSTVSSATIQIRNKVNRIQKPQTASKFAHNQLVVNNLSSKQSIDVIARNPADLAAEYRPVLDETAESSRKIMQTYRQQYREFSRALNDQARENHIEFLDHMRTSLYDDLGLNVDKEFTRRRLYGHATRVLVFYVYSKLVGDAVSHWKRQTAKLVYIRRYRAAVTIQRVIRGVLARMRHAQILENMRLQLEAEALARKKRQAWLNYNAYIITHAIVVYVKRKRIRFSMLRRKSATIIQRHIRGVLGRIKAVQRRYVVSVLNFSALRIQCAYRQRLARRRTILMKKLKFVRGYLESLRRIETQRDGFYEQNAAAWIIGRYYRAFQTRKKLQRLIYWHRVDVVVYLQSVVRRFLARRVFLIDLKNKRARDALEYAAATKIQTLMRCVLAKKKLKTKKFEKLMRQKERFQLKSAQMKRKETLGHKIQRWKRTYQLSKFEFESQFATEIQKIWRGVCARRKYYFLFFCDQIERLRQREKLEHKAAILIQKVYRGFIVRLRNVRKMQQSMVVRIQCLLRINKARKRTAKLRKEKKALIIISNKIATYALRKRYLKLKEWDRIAGNDAKTIQRLVRRYIARKQRMVRKQNRRREQESILMASNRLQAILLRVQLKLIVDSMYRPLLKQPYTVTRENCVCNGPLQALFVLAAVHRGNPEQNALLLNKMDKSMLLKFANNIEGLMKDGKPIPPPPLPELQKPTKYDLVGRKPNGLGSPKSRPSSMAAVSRSSRSKSTRNINSRQGSSSSSQKSILFTNIRNGVIPFPVMSNKRLVPTDLDMIFTRIRPGMASKGLGYPEYVSLMGMLAESYFGDENYQQLANDDVIANNEEATLGDQSQGNNDDLGTLLGGESVVEVKSIATMSSVQTRYPIENVAMNKHLAFMLRALVSFEKSDWMKQVVQWLNKESRARIEVFALRIQNMARRKSALNARMKLKKLRESNEESAGRDLRATVIQKVIRRFIAKHRMSRLAQRFYIKYVPFDTQPYFYNPSTRLSSFNKPKILLRRECVTISLPPTGMENNIKCSNCPRPALVNCVECEESSCTSCFDMLHSKGKRVFHHKTKIAHCGYCKVQMAFKNCFACVLEKPQPGTYKELLSDTERGLFCDVCFMYNHDSYEKHLERSDPKTKETVRQFMYLSKDAYLVAHQLHARIITSHKYENLVQPCEECTWRGASWRCVDCNQLYCQTCLTGMHSMGGPFGKHVAERIPYFTPEMHVSYQQGIIEQHNQKKMALLSRKAQRILEERQYASAIRIQTWWRRIFYARRGWKHMHIKRRLLRRNFRIRQKENKEVRSTRDYRIANMFGKARPLFSDTREEAALRVVPIWRRDRARHFIWKNIADWGHFRDEDGKLPRKGIPKTGFDVGSMSELHDQAIQGGYRMPGRVFVRYAKRKFTTKYDLSKFLRPGEMVRIKDHLFLVVSVSEDCHIQVNRNWPEEDINPEGEVLYRMPCYKNEPGVMEYRSKYMKYEFYVNKNVPFQLYLQAKILYANMMKKRYTRKYRDAIKRRGGRLIAREMKRLVGVYSKMLKDISVYVTVPDELTDVDLTKLDNPDEIEEKKALEQKERQAQQEVLAKQREILMGMDPSAIAEAGGEDLLNAVMNENSKAFQNMDDIINNRAPRALGEDDDEDLDDDGLAEEDHVGDMPVTSDSKPKSSKKATVDDDSSVGSSISLTSHSTTTRDKKNDKFRPPGQKWIATREETEERIRREEKMTPQELAAEAHEWEECYDPLNEVVYFVHKPTLEMMMKIPRSVQCFRQLEEDKQRNQRNYDEALKRIDTTDRLHKNRLKISGTRFRPK